MGPGTEGGHRGMRGRDSQTKRGFARMVGARSADLFAG